MRKSAFDTMDEEQPKVRTFHSPDVAAENHKHRLAIKKRKEAEVRTDEIVDAVSEGVPESPTPATEAPTRAESKPTKAMGSFTTSATYQAGDTVYMRDHDNKPIAFTVKKVKAGTVFIVHETGLQMQVSPSELLRKPEDATTPVKRTRTKAEADQPAEKPVRRVRKADGPVETVTVSEAAPDMAVVPDATEATPETAVVPDVTEATPETAVVPDTTEAAPETVVVPDVAEAAPDVAVGDPADAAGMAGGSVESVTVEIEAPADQEPVAAEAVPVKRTRGRKPAAAVVEAEAGVATNAMNDAGVEPAVEVPAKRPRARKKAEPAVVEAGAENIAAALPEALAVEPATVDEAAAAKPKRTRRKAETPVE